MTCSLHVSRLGQKTQGIDNSSALYKFKTYLLTYLLLPSEISLLRLRVFHPWSVDDDNDYDDSCTCAAGVQLLYHSQPTYVLEFSHACIQLVQTLIYIFLR